MPLLYRKFARICDSHGEKVAVIDSNEIHFTYTEIHHLVLDFSIFLSSLGEFQMTTVITATKNNLLSMVLSLACNRNGLSYLPLSHKKTKIQLNDCLSYLNANTLILSDSNTSKTKIWHTKTFGKLHFTLFRPNPPILSPVSHLSSSSLPFLYTFSSGSTGIPKLIGFSEVVKYRRNRQGMNIFSITPSDVILCASSFNHSLGQRLGFLALLAGATLILLDDFFPSKYLQRITDYRVTFIIPVASHIHAIFPFLDEKFTKLKSLRAMVTSSALINPDVKNHIISTAPFDFFEMYGASEVGTATLINFRDFDTKFNSVGRPCPNVKLKIIDKFGKESPSNSVGEILINSKYSIGSYPFVSDLHNSCFENGYFKTGDLGFLDEQGFLFFKGRKKDIIITGGINVFPTYIESKLRVYEDLIDILIVGLKDFYLGEKPVAIVAGCRDEKVAKIELRKLARQELATYERPFRYYFVQRLYELPSGKIDKSRHFREINNLQS